VAEKVGRAEQGKDLGFRKSLPWQVPKRGLEPPLPLREPVVKPTVSTSKTLQFSGFFARNASRIAKEAYPEFTLGLVRFQARMVR
jgi:hypothetical protein